MSTQTDIDRLIFARLLVSHYVRTTLYPTDTPIFQVSVLTAYDYGDEWRALLETDLPDGMLYTITVKKPGEEPELKAFKQLEDIQPH